MQLSTHSGRLERWLGPQAEVLAMAGRGWYGPPIPILGVPGGVHLRGGELGGDFVGPIDGGAFGNLYDFAAQRARAAVRRWSARQQRTANAGFSSLGDLISEATAGKKRIYVYQKTGATASTGVSNSLWMQGAQPAAGSIGAAAPGGTAHLDSDTGAFPFTNPTGGDTQHLTRWDGAASVAANTLLLYDRLFSVAANMNSTSTQAVTGVPTRYQNTTGGQPDSIAGNFLFFEVFSNLAATAHSWTTCTYSDQGGAGSTLPSVAGIVSNTAGRLDLPVNTWFAPLESGDTGVGALTQLQLSAAVASGTADAVIGHPIALLAHPVVQTMYTLDGVTGAFNLNRVFDDACLAFLEITKPATGATTYSGFFETVSG